MTSYDGDVMGEYCAEPGSAEAIAICMVDSVSVKVLRNVFPVLTAADMN